MGLTKQDIVTKVNEMGFSKKESVDIIESLLEIIKQQLENGEDVLISGFGKFCVKQKNQRRGRNPATDAPMITSPARRGTSHRSASRVRASPSV